MPGSGETQIQQRQNMGLTEVRRVVQSSKHLSSVPVPRGPAHHHSLLIGSMKKEPGSLVSESGESTPQSNVVI